MNMVPQVKICMTLANLIRKMNASSPQEVKPPGKGPNPHCNVISQSLALSLDILQGVVILCYLCYLCYFI